MIKRIFTIVIVMLIMITNVKAQQLTPKEVEQTIKEIGFKYPEVVYLQYKEESGLGQSRLARQHNNIFGMKSYKSRGGLNTTPNLQFASYKSQRESIIDRYILEVYNGWQNLGREEYLQKMRTIYCHNCKNYLVI